MKPIAACLVVATLLAAVPANAQTPSSRAVLIVAIGADNVAGFGRGKRRGGVPVTEAFPAQLQVLLRNQGVNAYVSNAGMPGDTCPGMLARLDDAVPDTARLVILDRPNGNDKQSGIKDDQADCMNAITGKLDARHVPYFILPDWDDIPGAADNRDPDGHHFTVEGHARIAAYLVPKVMAALPPP